MHAPAARVVVAAAIATLTIATAASAADVAFTQRFRSIPLGTTPQSLTVGDFNGDGHADVAITHTGASGSPTDSLARAYLGDGSGGFTSKGDIPVGRAPLGIASVDLDRDGVLDLAIASSGRQGVTLLRGKGDGTFGQRQDVSTGLHPVGVTASDVDGDGGNDLLVVHLGNGQSRPNELQAVASGDTAWTDSSGVCVLLARAPAKKGKAVRTKETASNPFQVGSRYWLKGGAALVSVAGGDVNADGRCDVVAASRGSNAILVWYGQAKGGFSSVKEVPLEGTPTDVAIGDLDGAGSAEIIASVVPFADGGPDRFGVAVLRQDGSKPSISWFDGTPVFRVRLADVDTDGKQDVLMLGRGRIQVLRGLGDGTLAPPVGYAADVAAAFAPARIDADAAIDLLVLNPRGEAMLLFEGQKDGTFGHGRMVPTGTSPAALAVADLNGDGKLDLATADNASGTVSVLLATSPGDFTPSRSLAAADGTQNLGTCDVDGDGDTDLVALCVRQRASQVLLFRNRGNGEFDPKTSVASGIDPAGLAVADLNGDGKADLVVPRSNQMEILLYLGNGNGTFQAPRRLATKHLNTVFTVGDANGDGKADLVTCDPRAGALTVWLGNGDATFTAAPSFKPRYEPASLALVDASGDGKTDLLIVPRRGLGVGAVLVGSGDGNFGQRIDFAVTANAGYPAVADFDGDGHVDLVTVDANTGCLALLSGLAAGGFGPAVDFGAGPDPSFIASGDFDADGKPDLAITSRAGNGIVLLRNLGPK